MGRRQVPVHTDSIAGQGPRECRIREQRRGTVATSTFRANARAAAMCEPFAALNLLHGVSVGALRGLMPGWSSKSRSGNRVGDNVRGEWRRLCSTVRTLA